MATLTLFSRPDCHLCAAMREALAPWASAQGHRIEERDVDDDPVTRRRYGHQIPVLEVDGIPACRVRLDLAAVERLLRPRASAR